MPDTTLRLRYRPSALTPGGISRNEPETVEELVEEIGREANASTFGGQIDLSIIKDKTQVVEGMTIRTINRTTHEVDDAQDLEGDGQETRLRRSR